MNIPGLEDDAALIEELARSVRARGRPLQAVVMQSEGDSYSLWYDLVVVEQASAAGLLNNEYVVASVGYLHGRGERIAKAAVYLLAQSLGVPAYLDAWRDSEPYVHHFPAAVEPLTFPPLALAELRSALDALRLPRGFVTQISGLDQRAWASATRGGLHEDQRAYMLIKEYAPQLDQRALLRVELDGSMCVWAALSLAELGWAPQFVFGPALHRAHDWSNVIGALRYLAHPLKAALDRLDEDAPVAIVGDRDAGVLAFQRSSDEDPLLPPYPEAFLEGISFESQRAAVLEHHAAQQRDRTRVIYPSIDEIRAHHANLTIVVTIEHNDQGVSRYTNHIYPELDAAGFPTYGLRINPYIDPPPR